MEFIVQSTSELAGLAEEILQIADQRKVFALYGQIGAGKTTFVRAISQTLGVEDQVSSPTYALVNVYQMKAANAAKLYHLDLYRLENIEAALEIGIEEYLYGDNYCFIEWPELIEAILPDETIRITIETIDHSTRKFIIH